MQVLDLPDGVNGDDVRVTHVCHCHRLLPEATHHPLASEEGGGHHLDRDLAIQRHLMCEVHRCHAASTELAKDLELAGRGAAKLGRDLYPWIRFLRACLTGGGAVHAGARGYAGTAPRAKAIGGAEWGPATFTAGRRSGRAAEGAKTIASPQQLATPDACNAGRLRGTHCHAVVTGLRNFRRNCGRSCVRARMFAREIDVVVCPWRLIESDCEASSARLLLNRQRHSCDLR